MKRQKEKRQEWIKNGHGEYEEIPEEKDFFEVSKKSESVVCHFYTDGNERCKVLLCTQLTSLEVKCTFAVVKIHSFDSPFR